MQTDQNEEMCIHADRSTCKQMYLHTRRQDDMQTDLCMNRIEYNNFIQFFKCTDMFARRQVDIQSWLTRMHAERSTCSQIDKQTGVHADTQIGRYAGR